MATAAQVITLVAKLDLYDTLLAILGGTGVTATLTLQSSAGGPQKIAYPVTAADITNWTTYLDNQKASVQSQLSALGVTLT